MRSWLRLSLRLSLLVCGLACASSVTAQADEAATDLPEAASWLRVERGDGSENCPDAEHLRARVQSLRANLPEPATGYEVVFVRADDTLSARLHARAHPANVRVLTARGASCEALAQASAVALALLLDAAPSAPESAPAATTPTAPAAPLERGSARPERPRAEAPRLRGSLQLGAGVLLGVMRLAAPLLEAELGMVHRRFRAALGVLGVPLDRAQFGPGSLRTWLLAGSAKVCAALLETAALRLDLCTGIYAGAIDVRARGYTYNERDKQLWLSVPLELSTRYMLGPVALAVGLGALLPLRRPDFSIDGLGSAYRSWPVSPLISLRLEAVLPAYRARMWKK